MNTFIFKMRNFYNDAVPENHEVDRKWGFWDIDLGNFQNWNNFFCPEFSRKIKNKNKK